MDALKTLDYPQAKYLWKKYRPNLTANEAEDLATVRIDCMTNGFFDPRLITDSIVRTINKLMEMEGELV